MSIISQGIRELVKKTISENKVVVSLKYTVRTLQNINSK
jgi:hypothetical protein